MNAMHIKSTFLHERIRRALQSGRYLPGQRIEPQAVAREFKTSVTPVRMAIHRLIGEGMIENHPRGGLYVPLLPEVDLRDRYDWMQHMLLMALEIGWSPQVRSLEAHQVVADPADIPKSTWKLFDAMAEATEQTALHQAVRRTNDQLAPVRRAKQTLIDNAHAELAELCAHWQSGEMAALKAGINAYYERRKRLVPRIVALLNAKRARLH